MFVARVGKFDSLYKNAKAAGAFAMPRLWGRLPPSGQKTCELLAYELFGFCAVERVAAGEGDN